MGQSSAVAVVLLAVAAVGWIVSVNQVDASIADLGWDGVLAVSGWVALAVRGERSRAAVAVCVVVSGWAVRLTWHLAIRKRRFPGEDARYGALRARCGRAFVWISLPGVFLLQAGIAWVVTLPLHRIGRGTRSTVVVVAGAAIALAGLAVETAADLALRRQTARATGTILRDGLWAWSRHPNYVGEAVCWLGIGTMAVAAGAPCWAMIGPLVLVLVASLRWFSGVPPLERRLARRPGYAEYARSTAVFVPWPRGGVRR